MSIDYFHIEIYTHLFKNLGRVIEKNNSYFSPIQIYNCFYLVVPRSYIQNSHHFIIGNKVRSALMPCYIKVRYASRKYTYFNIIQQFSIQTYIVFRSILIQLVREEYYSTSKIALMLQLYFNNLTIKLEKNHKQNHSTVLMKESS